MRIKPVLIIKHHSLEFSDEIGPKGVGSTLLPWRLILSVLSMISGGVFLSGDAAPLSYDF